MKKFAAILAAIMILAMLCGTIVPVAATEETPGEDVVEEIDSSMYDAAAEGDLLYTLNFNGDDIWQPRMLAPTEAEPEYKVIIEVDPDNPHRTKYTPVRDEARSCWGGEIKGLPLSGAAEDGSEDFYAYTITYKVTRFAIDPDTGKIIDSAFGVYVDSVEIPPLGQGSFGFSDKMGLSNAYGRICGGYVTFRNEGWVMEGTDYANTDSIEPSTQTYALEVNALDDTLKLYMVDSTDAWQLVVASEVGDIMTFNGTYLSPTLHTWWANMPVIVEDFKIYKGMTISGDELPVDPSTGAQDTTTVAQDTTTVPVDTTTVPADTTTVPQGNTDTTTTAPQGNTTTEAPESNGCGGFAVLPVSIVAILGLAVTVVAKKAL